MTTPTVLLAMLLRPGRLIALALLGAAIWAGLHWGSWITAQARAAGALATAYDAPLISWATKQVTDDPVLRPLRLGGVEVTVATPGGDGPWPAVVLLNGATNRGRFDADVLRLALGLARVGHLVVLPDVPGLARSTIGGDVAERTVAVARALAARGDARDGKVAFIGLGLGGTLALLAAEDPDLAELTSLVIAISPITDFAEIGRVITTGYQRVPGGFVKPRVAADLRDTAAASLVAALPAGRERDLLEQELASIEPGDANPFARLEDVPAELISDDAAAVIDLLTNRDPRAYDRLYGRLPPAIRELVESLSPVRDARRLRAPVELAAARDDPLVPIAQARALVRVAPDVRLTLSDAFSSTNSRPQLGSLGEALAINELIVRSLRLLRS